MQIKNFAVFLLSVALLVGVMNPSNAQDQPTPEQIAASAADTRQSVFKLLLFYLRPVAGMAQGAPFDAAVAEMNGRRIAALAPTIPHVFVEDTRGFDVETEALDVIWEDATGFAAKAQALVDNATAFADAASTGDRGQTLGAFRALGGSCGDCHDNFRVDTD
jgi:cytochrome c556